MAGVDSQAYRRSSEDSPPEFRGGGFPAASFTHVEKVVELQRLALSGALYVAIPQGRIGVRGVLAVGHLVECKVTTCVVVSVDEPRSPEVSAVPEAVAFLAPNRNVVELVMLIDQ